MGHFGPAHPPVLVRQVLPRCCCFFGQGRSTGPPEKAFNPFYALVPHSMLYPMVALATMATVIASQAMISGVFSLTQQAVQMGFCPRIRIVNTSAHTKGQIYLPGVNNAMMVACLGLVLAFKAPAAWPGPTASPSRPPWASPRSSTSVVHTCGAGRTGRPSRSWSFSWSSM
jgi:KUP system potassium uptake protein